MTIKTTKHNQFLFPNIKKDTQTFPFIIEQLAESLAMKSGL